MSVVECGGCGCWIDPKEDPDCYIEHGPRLRFTKVRCERCREEEEMEEGRPRYGEP